LGAEGGALPPYGLGPGGGGLAPGGALGALGGALAAGGPLGCSLVVDLGS